MLNPTKYGILQILLICKFSIPIYWPIFFIFLHIYITFVVLFTPLCSARPCWDQLLLLLSKDFTKDGKIQGKIQAKAGQITQC